MNSKEINHIISQALKEDRCRQDITTRLLIPNHETCKAFIIVKENATVCGLDVAKKVFLKIDPSIQFHSIYHNGAKVKKNTKIAFISGKARSILSAERVALNFLGILSGIATQTYQYVQKIRPYKAKVMDTRKTTPGLRTLEKMAVRCGGGCNHRFHLAESIFIKDNHKSCGKDSSLLSAMIQRVRKLTKKLVEVEVENLLEYKEALKGAPDIILLDNMTPQQMRKAVLLNKRRKGGRKILLEASGGVTLKNVRAIARTGVDRISIGALTHSRKSIDLSLEVIN